jgi:Fe-coproporphyrin III synthase
MIDLNKFVLNSTKRKTSEFVGPVIVWNLTAKCNLKCLHCYAAKDSVKSPELSKNEILKVVPDFIKIKVPLVIFSGGEPLLAKDLFYICTNFKDNGIRTSLSTNGTLINKLVAKNIKKSGIGYVGVSIDGIGSANDFLRGKRGAFSRTLKAIAYCKEEGLKTGIRFTVAEYNIKELKSVLRLCEELEVERFCLYGLVYSGRAKDLANNDLSKIQKRRVLETLIDFTKETKGKIEVLTTDNPCDGAFLNNPLGFKEGNVFTGGCAAGVKLFNIDEHGFVHPCQFWQDYNLGNIKKDTLSGIVNGSNELLMKLNHKEDFLKGKCGFCDYKLSCGGCRVRAKAVFKDAWQEDPACFLNEEETKINVVSHLSSAATA